MEELEAIVLKLQNLNLETYVYSLWTKIVGKGVPEIPRPFLTWHKDFSSLTITPTHFPFVAQD